MSPATTARATLPVTLTPERRAAIRQIDGSAGWPRRAAEILADPSAVVLVDRPSSADVDLTDDQAARVVLDTPWAHGLAVHSAVHHLTVGPGELVEVRVEAPADAALDRTLLDAIILADALVGVRSATVLSSTADHRLVIGTTATDARFLVDLARSSAFDGSASIRATAGNGLVTLELPPPAIARPARLTVARLADSTAFDGPWETPSRSAWRLAAALADSPAWTGETDVHRFRRLHDLIRNRPSERHRGVVD